MDKEDVCINCKQPPYPRGFEVVYKMCWHCVWIIRPWKKGN